MRSIILYSVENVGFFAPVLMDDGSETTADTRVPTLVLLLQHWIGFPELIFPLVWLFPVDNKCSHAVIREVYRK